MFQSFTHRCPACGSLLRTWHQNNVKTVKCPCCWSDVLVEVPKVAARPIASGKDAKYESHRDKISLWLDLKAPWQSRTHCPVTDLLKKLNRLFADKKVTRIKGKKAKYKRLKV